MNNAETVSYIKSISKKAGLTFKANESLRINGGLSYQFIVRGGGEVVLNNCTLGSSLNMACSGYIESWNGERFTQQNQV